LLILHQREPRAALPITSDVNKDLGSRAKDHRQGQELRVSRPRTWILALTTKAKD